MIDLPYLALFISRKPAVALRASAFALRAMADQMAGQEKRKIHKISPYLGPFICRKPAFALRASAFALRAMADQMAGQERREIRKKFSEGRTDRRSFSRRR